MKFFIQPLKAALGCLLFFPSFNLYSQSLPVGTQQEEVARRMQLTGERPTEASMMIRPLYSGEHSIDSTYNFNNVLGLSSVQTKWGKSNLYVSSLPLQLNQQYNTSFPQGWNDGSMIPAKGYQLQARGGIFAKLGLLTIQLQPEVVYAQNRPFETVPLKNNDSITRSYYNTVLNVIDAPQRFGNRSYSKIFPGQSGIRLNYKKLSLGLSTENLWWGPGTRNSLTMSNNAPGFPHITFNTTAPVKTPIGAFEWQLISGRLKSSGIEPDSSATFQGNRLAVQKPGSDRYINGLTLTWQPKWIKGLYLGFSDVFYLYEEDIQPGLKNYLPVLGWVVGTNNLGSIEQRTDQMISFSLRYLLPKEGAEIYGEVTKNDNSLNLLDLFLEPEHATAYMFGLKKIWNTKKSSQLELMAEFTQLKMPATLALRFQESLYSHFQVLHGYTNRGQIMGAGIGQGSNSQTIGLHWVNGVKKTGFMIERVLHNNDFYYNAFTPTRNFQQHWVDLNLNVNKTWNYKRMLLTGNLTFTRAFNFNWQYNNHLNNLYAGLAVSYFL